MIIDLGISGPIHLRTGFCQTYCGGHCITVCSATFSEEIQPVLAGSTGLLISAGYHRTESVQNCYGLRFWTLDTQGIWNTPLQADVLKTSMETGMEFVWNGMEFCGILWTNWNYTKMDFLA